MTPRALTQAEAKIYRAVRAFHRLDPPIAPTLAEIAGAIGWTQRTAVHPYIRQLEQAGYVHRIKGKAGVQLGPKPTRKP